MCSPKMIFAYVHRLLFRDFSQKILRPIQDYHKKSAHLHERFIRDNYTSHLTLALTSFFSAITSLSRRYWGLYLPRGMSLNI